MARTAIHPGEHLKDELASLGISAAELARQIEVPTNRITGILNGERSLTAATAVRPAYWFGTSADFGLNLQKTYDLRVAERALAKTLPRLKRLSRGERPVAGATRRARTG